MSNIVEAEQHKKKGNAHFSSKDYNRAITEYSLAINKAPNNSVYYTNRALCYLKMKNYGNVIADCEMAIKQDPTSVKGYYMLGQALTEQIDFDTAISNLQKAYDLTIKDKGVFSAEIVQALLSARKKKWNLEEKKRIDQESDLLRYVKGLINAERDRQLQKVSSKSNMFSKIVSSHPPDVQEKMDIINQGHNEKLSQIEQVFSQSDENLKVRDLPDHFLDKISFNIMHDPVITPSGITYERAHLKEHFKKIGHFDPLSRRECRESDLYPNLAMKEAIEDFLSKNGWAADY
ncbi:8578_t:CDS:1 [Dentiscutata erythropus]|uniref:E3 ubiquitin-protein ligase CHIP n=1 Tax=Dentiscutata erythropus TaxID=1348616 RepID=A0A9N8WAB8_9GLOM|nr:8578_t:CDS:1 [Dentiscutata erythropus]